MMRFNRSAWIAIALTTVGLGGCAGGVLDVGSTPNYDAQFGQAVRQAVARQTMNPEGSGNTDPVSGIDGKAAKSSMDRYHDSFRSPTKTFQTLGIGEGVSTGQGQ